MIDTRAAGGYTKRISREMLGSEEELFRKISRHPTEFTKPYQPKRPPRLLFPMNMTSPRNTILIVDDDPLHLKIYTWILEREGYHCLTALVGSKAVDLPEGERIDLILLDYRLSSSITAPESAKRLKQLFSGVPVVVLSELPWMPVDMAQHAVAFINKGNPNRLVDTVAQVVGSKSTAA